jgi:hypothetical protein
MKTYKIVEETNSYIAQRDIEFNGRTSIVIYEDLTLREAQKKLLDMFNEDYDTCYPNWGLVRAHFPFNSSTYSDGTHSYEFDSRRYGIVEED